jgi:hypothetical protein
LCWIFLRSGLGNYLLGLFSNRNPPDLCFLTRITGVSHQCLASAVDFKGNNICKMPSTVPGIWRRFVNYTYYC